MFKIAFISLIFLLFGISQQSVALPNNNTAIKIKTIPEEPYEGESFTLVFLTPEHIDDKPDFSLLEKDFTIIHITRRSRFTHQNNWMVELIPDRSGASTIPPISFGKHRSQILTINIKPKKNQQSLTHQNFISELEVSHTNVLVRSEIIVTQRLLSTRRTANSSFSELKISGVKVVQKKLHNGLKFDITRGDRSYHVLETHHAIYPQQAGLLTIEPSVAVAKVSAHGDGNTNMLTLMNDAITKNARSKPVEIIIKTIPDNTRVNPQNWLPAKEVKLQAQWSNTKPTFKVGDNLTRSLTLFVDGQMFSQIPRLEITPVENLKRYTDKPTRKNKLLPTGIRTSIKLREVFIATQSGTYLVPAIEIPWWNTRTNKPAVATIPSRRITVVEGVKSALSDKVEEKELSKHKTSTKVSKSDREKHFLWLTIFLGIVGLGVALLWLKKRLFRRIKSTAYSSVPSPNNLYQARKNLKVACDGLRASRVQSALIAWGRVVFNNNRLNNLGALKKHSESHLQSAAPLLAEIKKLEEVLYSTHTSDWNAKEIWRTSQLIEVQKQKHERSTDLEPLYYL